MTARQLPLAWPAPAHCRFEHFEPSGNEAAVSLLDGWWRADAAGAAPVLLAGPAGCGKTHLLIAVAAAARDAGQRTLYVALSRWSDFDADALDAMASGDLLAIDEIDSVAGNRIAEIALFDLYNRCRDRGSRLLMASRQAPARLPLVLPDLRSRLDAATLMPLSPLDEPARRELVRRRAASRGFVLEAPVIEFLFRRHPRDMHALMALVDRLDRESLARQRRVTLALVRDVMDAGSGPAG
jgi:DnaA family protein